MQLDESLNESAERAQVAGILKEFSPQLEGEDAKYKVGCGLRVNVSSSLSSVDSLSFCTRLTALNVEPGAALNSLDQIVFPIGSI